MKQPELIPNAEKIDKLIGRINSGDIKIPAFQRGFVWKQNQIIDLVESILHNYPIGSLLLWNTNDSLNYTRDIAGYEIPETKPEYPVNYVLDGQQRLSTIYGVFSGDTKQSDVKHIYEPQQDIFELYYDFENRRIVNQEDAELITNKIELRKILDAKSYIDALKELNEHNLKILTEVFSNFSNYEIPVITIKHRTKNEVGVIFERINNTGTKLSTLDLMVAWTWTDDFNFMNKIEEFFEELDEKNFGGISKNLLLQIISGLIQNDTKTSRILDLSGEDVRNQWSNCKEAIKKGIDFLSTELNCKNLDFLPYHQQLAGISKFFQIIKKPSVAQIILLKKWFWKHSFTIKYFTGQTTEKMNIDIQIMEQIKEGNYNYFNNLTINVNSFEIINTKFSKASYLTRSFLLLSAQYTPLDLCNGSKIDVGRSLSTYNRKEYHHVFPKAYLKKKGYELSQINSIMNFCFLPADSNKIIRMKEPSDYFYNIIPDKKFDEILQTNLLPLNSTIYKENNYNMFLEKRAELVILEIKKLLN